MGEYLGDRAGVARPGAGASRAASGDRTFGGKKALARGRPYRTDRHSRLTILRVPVLPRRANRQAFRGLTIRAFPYSQESSVLGELPELLAQRLVRRRLLRLRGEGLAGPGEQRHAQRRQPSLQHGQLQPGLEPLGHRLAQQPEEGRRDGLQPERRRPLSGLALSSASWPGIGQRGVYQSARAACADCSVNSVDITLRPRDCGCGI